MSSAISGLAGSNAVVADVFTWDTGRGYGETGLHRLAAFRLPSTGKIAFTDVDRGVNGVTKNTLPNEAMGLTSVVQQFVMDEYDNMLYTGDFYHVPDIGGDFMDTSGVVTQMRLLAKEQIQGGCVNLYEVKSKVFDPTMPVDYARVMADEKLQLEYQDKLDSFFGSRVVDIRNALREMGWEGESRALALSKGGFQVVIEPVRVGAGNNVVGSSWFLLSKNNMALPLDFRKVAVLPDFLLDTAVEFVAEIDRLASKEIDRISVNLFKAPQCLTFKEFSAIATVEKLENHGRKWSIEFGDQNLGFADGPSAVGGLREAHSNCINNAIFSHSTDAVGVMDKRAFPPERVMAEYPELREKFVEVFKVRDVQLRTKEIIESVSGFIDDHKDWWNDQLASSGSEHVRNGLKSLEFAMLAPGDPKNAADCLLMFVGFVRDGFIDWVDNSIPDCLENVLFSEAQGIVGGLSGVGAVVKPDVGLAGGIGFNSEYVKRIIVNDPGGFEHVYKVFKDAYGPTHKQERMESDNAYVDRCAEQDFNDGETGGAIYQNVFDDIRMESLGEVVEGSNPGVLYGVGSGLAFPSSSESFTVWVYELDDAQHHDNDLTVDTVDDLDVATAIARCRVKDTNQCSGWAKIIDNNIAGKYGDHGNILEVIKNNNGVTFATNKRAGVEFEDIQARASKSYFGAVAKVINSEFALQDVGRKQVVLHQLSKLDTALKLGDVAGVKYDANGQGKVTLEKVKDKSVGR